MISTKHTFLVIAFVGVFFVISGFVGIDYIRKESRSQLSQKLPLLNGSESTKKWVNNGQPGFVHMYLFNVTNSQQLETGEETRIKLQEIGPFVYEFRPSIQIDGWSADKTHIRYRVNKTYVFDPTRSPYPLNTPIRNINIPLVSTITAALESQRDSIFINTFKSTLNYYISSFNEELFVTRTADELLFRGYKIPMVERFLTTASWVVNVQVPPNGTFGLFYGKNNTDNGEWEMFTGIDSITQLGQVNRWNKLTKNTCWSSDECNKIAGSDGIRYAPNLDAKINSTVKLYSPNLHRTVQLDFQRKFDLKGIEVFRYDMLSNNFAPTPENSCYCPDPNRKIGNESLCSFGGLQDVSACERQVPLVVSLPHMLHASPKLLQQYEGLKPDVSLHQPYIHVDPFTGMSLSGMKGMQINFLVQKYPGVRNFEKVNNLLFPVIWIKEFAVISDEKAQLYHKAIHQKINWSFYIACGVLAFGSFLFAIGAIGFLYMLTRSKSNEDIVKDTSMYTKASKTEVKNRYNQSDVQNGEEAQNL